MKRVWVPVVALLALSACEEEVSGPVSTETGGEAAGEILGGTISDDMIPLEELTSTSPPAERAPSERLTAGPTQPEPRAAPEPAVETQEAAPSEESPASE